MMPDQAKQITEYYQQNPSAVASLRGGIYEDKIISLIKEKARSTKKTISIKEAEKIILDQNKEPRRVARHIQKFKKLQQQNLENKKKLAKSNH